MAKRNIIKIDEDKCNGCGQCMPNCPEGAIQMIDGKARLISDLFCDGLGACIGYCPQSAITVEIREAQEYDEKKVMANIVKQGKNVIKAHLEHLEGHKQDKYLKEAVDYLRKNNMELPLKEKTAAASQMHACPGSKMMDFRDKQAQPGAVKGVKGSGNKSQLKQWPVQIMLVPPFAPYLSDSDLLIAADCVPFTYADFHEDLLSGKTLLVGCPKLDDVKVYKDKFIEIIKNNNIKSITYADMEVPCCFGLVGGIEEAIAESGKKVPFKEAVISIRGGRLE